MNIVANCIARIYTDMEGNLRVAVSHNDIEIVVDVDADGAATVSKCVWNPVVASNMREVPKRRETCSKCEHAGAIGKITVTCGLCGCGGLRLDGPPNTCRANKW